MIITELLAKVGLQVSEHDFDHLHERLEGIHHAVGALAAIEIAKAIAELAEKFAGLGESIETSAIQTGLGIEQYQALAFAATQNALSTEEMTMALARLNKQLYSAQNGGAAAEKAFKMLGVSKETVMSMHTSRDALLAVADGVGRLKTSQEKQQVVQQLFGRGGAKYLKFLSLGAKGIEEMEKRGIRIGAVLGEDNVEALAEFEDAMSGLLQVMKMFGAFLGATIAPTLKFIIEKFEDFWAVNQKIIKTDAEEWLKKVAYAFGFAAGLVVGLTEEMSYLYRAFHEQIDTAAKWGFYILALGAAFEIAASLIGKFLWPVRAIYTVFTAFQAAGGLANMLGMGLLLLKAAAVAIALVTIYETLVSIWELLHGVSWENTSFVKMAMRIDKMTGAATALGDAFRDLPQNKDGFVFGASKPDAPNVMDEMAAAGADASATLGRLSWPQRPVAADAQQGFGPLNNELYAGVQRGAEPGLQPGGFAWGSAPQQNQFTFNVTGANADDIAKTIMAKINEKQAQLMNNAKRDMASAVVR